MKKATPPVGYNGSQMSVLPLYPKVPIPSGIAQNPFKEVQPCSWVIMIRGHILKTKEDFCPGVMAYLIR